MPHNLTHIITAVRASGRTTTHGAILLAEVDRLTAENAELKTDLDAATAWLRDIYRTAPAQETAKLRPAAQKIADGLNDAIEGRYRTVAQEPPLTGYRVFWSAEDEGWVGQSIAYPSDECLAETPEAAIRGIIKLLQSVALDELLAEITQEMDECCHKTRLRDAPCPVGLKCPFIKETTNV